MSISNQTDKIFGTGDGVTTVFSFPFKIFNATDLVVYEIDATQNPNITHGPYVLNTDYSVSINTVSEGGTVTFTVAPPLNWQTLLQRVEPFTQSVVLNTEGNLPAQQIGNQLDLMTMLCIQVNEAVSRCPQLPVTYSGTLPLAMPLPQAGLVIGWDPTGTFLTNLVATAIGNIAVPISNGNIQALTVPNKVSGAALYNLNLTAVGAGVIPIANIPTIPLATGVSGLIAAANVGSLAGTLSSSFNFASVYQAATDGVVAASYGNGGGGSAGTSINIKSDSNSSPSLVIANARVSAAISDTVFVAAYIKKGYYFQVNETTSATGTAGIISFTPIGS